MRLEAGIEMAGVAELPRLLRAIRFDRGDRGPAAAVEPLLQGVEQGHVFGIGQLAVLALLGEGLPQLVSVAGARRRSAPAGRFPTMQRKSSFSWWEYLHGYAGNRACAAANAE
ncbi:MAG TPA: hypothetical protein VL051_10440 [Burkholderiaceae bacterium]|nr:hypothetical protein [Burkholderiaceae bacterium]